MVVTREEFDDWLESPVTKKLKTVLKSELEELKDGIVEDRYADIREVIGRCRAIEAFLTVKYEDIHAE